MSLVVGPHEVILYIKQSTVCKSKFLSSAFLSMNPSDRCGKYTVYLNADMRLATAPAALHQTDAKSSWYSIADKSS